MARSLSGAYSSELPAELHPALWPWPLRAAAFLAFLALLFVGILFQPWLVFAGLLAAAVLFLGLLVAWYYPEFGLLALIFLGSSILDPNLISIPSPVGSIDFPDLVLLGLGGLSILRVVNRNGHLLPRSGVLPPFFVLMWLAAVSALLAVLVRSVEPNLALSELRGLMYYSTLLLVMWDIRQRAQLIRLLWGLYLIGLFVVGIMIVQQFVGPVPFFAAAQSPTWMIVGSSTGGLTRIRPPAHVLLYFLSLLSAVLAAFLPRPRARLVMFGLAVFMNLALLLTFTRSQWVASALALGLALLLFPRHAQSTALLLGLAALLVAAGVFFTQRSQIQAFLGEVNFATPLVKRVESMFELDQTLNSYSAQNRYFQTGAALVAIRESPVTGVGLGNAYRGLTSKEAETRYVRFIRFIENSYLYVATKMGLPALAILAWLFASVLAGAWRGFRAAVDPLLRGVSLACLVSVAGIIAWAFNHPLLMLPEYTIMIGLIFGLSEAVRLMPRRETEGKPNESPV